MGQSGGEDAEGEVCRREEVFFGKRRPTMSGGASVPASVFCLNEKV